MTLAASTVKPVFSPAVWLALLVWIALESLWYLLVLHPRPLPAHSLMITAAFWTFNEAVSSASFGCLTTTLAVSLPMILMWGSIVHVPVIWPEHMPTVVHIVVMIFAILEASFFLACSRFLPAAQRSPLLLQMFQRRALLVPSYVTYDALANHVGKEQRVEFVLKLNYARLRLPFGTALSLSCFVLLAPTSAVHLMWSAMHLLFTIVALFSSLYALMSPPAVCTTLFKLFIASLVACGTVSSPVRDFVAQHAHPGKGGEKGERGLTAATAPMVPPRSSKPSTSTSVPSFGHNLMPCWEPGAITPTVLSTHSLPIGKTVTVRAFLDT